MHTIHKMIEGASFDNIAYIMERHTCLTWPKRRLYIQNIVSLCQFIITLYELVISL